MTDMTAEERADKLRLTLLEDLEKTNGDIPNTVRWLGNNACDEIRQAEAAARKAEQDKLWECPECAFTFDRDHTNADGSLTCPLCVDIPEARKAALAPLGPLLKRYINVAMQVHCEMGDTTADARHRVEQEIEVKAARRALAESEKP